MMPYATLDLLSTMNDPVITNALVEAMHHNLYTIINSAAMNGVGPNTTVNAVNPNIVNTVLIVTAVLGVLAITGSVIFFRKSY